MPVRTEELRDRVLGCFVGLAVGDALGAPHRGLSHYQIEARYPDGVQQMTGGGKQKLNPGQWTATAEQAVIAAESYLANKGFEGLDLSLRLSRLLENGREGFTFELVEVLRALEEDPEAWPNAARRVWYESGGTFAGNGALARAVPIGLRCIGDLPTLIAETIRIVHLTHYDPRAVEAAIALNFLILQCVRGTYSPEIAQVCAGFLESIRSEDVYRENVLDFDKSKFSEVSMESPMRSYAEDRDAVVTALRKADKLHASDLNVSSSCIHTLSCGVWALAKAKDFGQGVASVVARGGECDKTGAIAGALLGARFGMSGIPKTWLAALSDRVRLVNVADQIVAGIGSGT